MVAGGGRGAVDEAHEVDAPGDVLRETGGEAQGWSGGEVGATSADRRTVPTSDSRSHGKPSSESAAVTLPSSESRSRDGRKPSGEGRSRDGRDPPAERPAVTDATLQRSAQLSRHPLQRYPRYEDKSPPVCREFVFLPSEPPRSLHSVAKRALLAGSVSMVFRVRCRLVTC